MNISQRHLIAFIFLFIAWTENVGAMKMYEGRYTLLGYAISEENVIIKNAMLIVNDKDTIYTDHRGIFTYEIRWVARPNLLGYIFFPNQSFNQKNQNQGQLSFRLGETKTIIKNKWRKYGLRNYKRNRPEIRLANLYFKSND